MPLRIPEQMFPVQRGSIAIPESDLEFHGTKRKHTPPAFDFQVKRKKHHDGYSYECTYQSITVQISRVREILHSEGCVVEQQGYFCRLLNLLMITFFKNAI